MSDYQIYESLGIQWMQVANMLEGVGLRAWDEYCLAIYFLYLIGWISYAGNENALFHAGMQLGEF